VRWPWISRVAYDDLRTERDRLLALVEKYAEHEIRLVRKEAGLPERMAQQKDPPGLSQEVLRACERWGDSAPGMRREAERMLRLSKSEWEILEMLSTPTEV
jgi:hypothetical protein